MVLAARSDGDHAGPTRDQLVALDLDCRLTWLWRQIWAESHLGLETVAAYIRYAYGQGYGDALTEDLRGRLYSDHAYDVPKRKPKDRGT